MRNHGDWVALCCLLAAILTGGAAFAQTQEPAAATGAEPSGEDAKDEKKKDDEPKDFQFSDAVVVTATRVETDLMETPIAVTVIDQETMDREGVQNVRDIAQMVPNMDIATINGQSAPIISLRGIRSTNETELGDPAVGVHLDGIYSPRMQGILGLMFDNERVEVLRGPQGTLFGRNSTVGSINIVSAKPKLDAFASSLGVQYGNYNAPELQGMVNKPISDTFAVRFAGRYHQRDSYVDGYWDPNQFDQRSVSSIVPDPQLIGTADDCIDDRCYTRTQKSNWWGMFSDENIFALQRADEDDFYMNAKEWAYRASATWQPKYKDVSLNVAFQQFRSDSAGGIDLVNCDKLRGRPNYDAVFQQDANGDQVLDDNGDPIFIGFVQNGTADCSSLFPEDETYQAVVNTPGRFYLDIMYLRSQFSWDITDNLRLVHLTGAEDQDRESAQDMEQSLNAWDQSFYFLPGTGSQSWSQEVQLQSFGNPHFNWIAGANYFYEKTSTLGFFDNAIGEKSMFDQPDRSSTASALFAQGTYSYNDRWHLTLGGRFSDETKQDKGGRTLLCRPDNGCGAGVIGTGEVDDGLVGFDRDDLNSLPVDFFADQSVYPSDAIQANDNRGSWNHSDWRVGLDYQRDSNSLWYTYLATGFKAGGIGDVFEGFVVDGDFDSNGNPIVVSAEEVTLRTAYDPEEVTTLELGFKERYFDGKLQVMGAYFYSIYKDLQYASVGALAFTEEYLPLFDVNGDPVDNDGDGRVDRDWVGRPLITAYFTQNVPDVEIQGLELEYDWRAWPGGRVKGYVSWLDTEITEDWITKWDYDPVSYLNLNFDQAQDATNDALQVNLKGNEMAVSPPIKFHVTVDHAFAFPTKGMTVVPWLTAHWEAGSYLTIWNVDQHIDDMNFAILDEDIRYTDDRREAWSMFHGGVRLYRGNLMAELYGYNITDEVVQWWGGAAEQVAKGSLSMPAVYGFRVGYKF